MNYRQKTKQRHYQRSCNNYTPIIGILNHQTLLDCDIELKKQFHTFQYQFQHPLQTLLKIALKRKKQAFEKIISLMYDLSIAQQNIYLPQALLRGDNSIISQYKAMLQKGRINSYIKLNINKRQVSRQKKPLSCDYRPTKFESQQTTNNVFRKQFINVNTGTSKKHITKNNQIYQTSHQIHVNHIDHNKQIDYKYHKDQINLKQQKDRKLNNSSEHQIHYSYPAVKRFSSTFNGKVLHNQQKKTNYLTVSKQKTKSKMKKNNAIKINVAYQLVNGNNPQHSTFICKSNVSKSKRAPSNYAPKTDRFQEFTQQFQSHQNQIMNIKEIQEKNKIKEKMNIREKISVKEKMNNNEKISIQDKMKNNEKINIKDKINKKEQFITTYQDEILSERIDRSLRNSQISQITQKDIHQDDYFFNSKPSHKKGRKAVYFQQQRS